MKLCPDFLHSGPNVPWINPECIGIANLPPRAHLHSFENEANFFGLKNNLNSSDKVINYCGELVALQYLLYDLRLKDKNSGFMLFDKLNGGVIKNLQEKRSYNEKFKNPFEPYIKKIYDLFLKSNNQNEGIKSYNLVVNLLIQDYQSKINKSVDDSS